MTTEEKVIKFLKDGAVIWAAEIVEIRCKDGSRLPINRRLFHKLCNEAKLRPVGSKPEWVWHKSSEVDITRIEISFGVYQIKLELNDKSGGGKLISNLKDVLAAANGDDDAIEYNLCVDGLESLVLAQACAGINVQSPAYSTALLSAMDAIYNNTAG